MNKEKLCFPYSEIHCNNWNVIIVFYWKNVWELVVIYFDIPYFQFEPEYVQSHDALIIDMVEVVWIIGF